VALPPATAADVAAAAIDVSHFVTAHIQPINYVHTILLNPVNALETRGQTLSSSEVFVNDNDNKKAK